MIAQKPPTRENISQHNCASRKYLWKKFRFELGAIHYFCFLPVLYLILWLFRSQVMEKREKEIFPYQWNALLRSQAAGTIFASTVC